METNKIDKFIRDSFKDRSLQPSASAWERLADKLDAQEERRTQKPLFWKVAASIALLLSVGYFLIPNDTTIPIKSDEIVFEPTLKVKDLVTPTLVPMTPVQEVVVVVEKENLKQISVQKPTLQVFKPKEIEVTSTAVASIGDEADIMKTNLPAVAGTKTNTKAKTKTELNALDFKKSTEVTASIKTSIKVNSADLLFAVSNDVKDVQAYYAKYNVDRAEILKSIENELLKTSLRIDAQTVLTEVEKNIDEETFKKNFMQVVKGKINGLASSFSNRNN